jgi:essential nuclear protein 1
MSLLRADGQNAGLAFTFSVQIRQTPKPFKIIPTLPQWEDLLYTDRNHGQPTLLWSDQDFRLFETPSSSDSWAVIVERVREDIHETKKLNVHLYNALKKALYKPAAFFKGFLFPTRWQWYIRLRGTYRFQRIGRVSIPVLHSAAALLRLCDIAAEQTSVSTEGGGATNIFIRVLLEKKYALPYKVIDALVFHFLRFRAVTL